MELGLQTLECDLKVTREVAGDLNMFAGDGVGELQLAGMKPLPGHTQSFCQRGIGAIECVTDDGVTMGRHMNPNLVGAPSF